MHLIFVDKLDGLVAQLAARGLGGGAGHFALGTALTPGKGWGSLMLTRYRNCPHHDLSKSRMMIERAGRNASAVQVQVGARRYPALRANLSHALLSGARLIEADLAGADLGDANLQGADLSRANLSYANLQGADLSGATLTEAALIGTNLQGADLSEATLTWALLDEADLRGAKVTEEQLQVAVSEKNVNLRGDRDGRHQSR
jgi:uncharacterized protein YjbI with pentapeptide repeats